MSIEAFFSWLESWLVSFGLDAASTDLALQVFFVVFFTLIASLGTRIIHKRVLKRIEEFDVIWAHALIDAIGGQPIRWFIWLIGITFAAQIIGAHSDAPIFAAVTPIRKIGVIALMAWMLTRLIRNLSRAWVKHQTRKKTAVDESAVGAIAKLLHISVVITAILIGLQSLGFSISGVLAFGGIGGIAIGFAAKDLLANLFGAVTIYFDRPFVVGDWIRSPDRDIEGTVEDIGWRLTRIRTFDKRPLYVPNAVFTQISVENATRMTHRRIKETIGIRYDDLDKMQAITDDVREMLIDYDEIDSKQTIIVHFLCFSHSSVDIYLYAFTRTTAWVTYHAVKQEVLLRMANIIESHGAQIAFPTQTLHVPEGVRLESASDLLVTAEPINKTPRETSST